MIAAIYSVAIVFGLVALAAALALFGMVLGVKGLRLRIAKRRDDRAVAELLARFPVQTPAHEKAVFDALMGHRYQDNVVPFHDARRI